MRLRLGVKFDCWRGRVGVLASLLFVVSLTVFTSSPSHALNFELGEGVSLDVDTTIRYSAQMRVEDQSRRLLANPNIDDGNRNFDKYDITSNRFQITSDAELTWNNLGAFVRGRAFYDFSYMSDNENDSPLTNNAFLGGLIKDPQDFTDECEDAHGKDAEILDAFVYGEFDLAEHPAELRVGYQVVSWGESLFILNSVSTAMAPVDARMVFQPGTELRDIFLPVPQVYGSIGITDDLTLAGYYQWGWEESRLPEDGYHFALNHFSDLLFESASVGIIPTPFNALHVDDKDVSDSGQYGVALRYISAPLNETEFGLYYINYHEKIPILNNYFVPNPGPGPPVIGARYSFEYPEDIKLYGFSIGTALWDINWGIEMSYRDGYYVGLEPQGPAAGGLDIIAGWAEAEIFQGMLSFIALYPETFFANNWTIMGEVAFNDVVDYEYDGERPLLRDGTAWGFVTKITPSWNGVLPNLDVSMPITAKINPSRFSSVQATFVENSDSISLGFDFTYRSVWQWGISYVNYFGGPEHEKDYYNVNDDRDYIGFTMKYSF